MPRIFRQPRFWLITFIIWASILWYLSSRDFKGFPVTFNHIDKVKHFGYFFGGSGLLSAWLYLRNPESPNWRRLIITSILILAVVGAVDEYHQSFTPGRSGNDFWDWLADVVGATAGAFTFKAVHRVLK